MLEDVAERASMLVHPARKRPRGVQLRGLEAAGPGPNTARRRPQADGERIAERVGRIGRDDEHAPAGGGFGHSPRRRTRRLTDAAFAAEKDEMRLEAEPGRLGAVSRQTSNFRSPHRSRCPGVTWRWRPAAGP